VGLAVRARDREGVRVGVEVRELEREGKKQVAL
jgi:hypothetical protein